MTRTSEKLNAVTSRKIHENFARSGAFSACPFCFPNKDHVTIPERVFFFPKLADIFMLVRSLFDEHDKGSKLLGIVT